MKRLTVTFGLLCAALATPAAAQSAPEAILKLEQYRKGVAARVVVAGKPRLFTFDTGGGITVLSPALAKEVGCSPFGKLAGHRMTGDKLEMPRCDRIALRWGATPLTARVVGIYDVTPLAAANAELVDGLLALDVFAGRTVTLDMAGTTLTIETSASAAERVQDAIEVPARLAREIGGRALAVYIDVATPKGPLSMELDSANGGTILVSKPYAGAFGLDPDAPGPQPGRFEVAPGVEAEGTMFTPDLLIDGNLGAPFLKYWIVTMDLANGRVWLRRNPVPPPPGMGVAPQLSK